MNYFINESLFQDRSGIFFGYSESEYGFAHLGFQEYLAAEEIGNNNKLDLLMDNYGNRQYCMFLNEVKPEKEQLNKRP
jgi:predicted NACHT family NTPase